LSGSGCRGPVGPPGLDAPGFDVVPPTVELVEPWPLSTVWDSFNMVAAAVDNVAIREVYFFIDGSAYVNGQVLVLDAPPYSFTLEAAGFERGWHFISARACDSAGNLTDTPVVPVMLGFSEDLQDTVVNLSYHNDVPDTTLWWSIPATNLILPGDTTETTIQTSAFWVRFNPGRDCLLSRVSLHIGGSFSDSAEAAVSIWKGTGYPAAAETTVFLPGYTFTGNMVEDVMERWVDFGSFLLQGKDDFFIVASMDHAGVGDTLLLAGDNGEPHWGRSGSRDDDGWHTLDERCGRRNNFLITCELYYEPVDSL